MQMHTVWIGNSCLLDRLTLILETDTSVSNNFNREVDSVTTAGHKGRVAQVHWPGASSLQSSLGVSHTCAQIFPHFAALLQLFALCCQDWQTCCLRHPAVLTESAAAMTGSEVVVNVMCAESLQQLQTQGAQAKLQ